MSAKGNSFIAKKKILPWLAAAVLYLIFCLTGTLYADYDNYNVAIVLNGLLGNNNFCPYQHPLLCVICAGLKLLLPGADVFTLTAHILLIAALGWMTAILWERFESWQGRVAVAAGVAYLCFGMVLWNVNYTVWAAFFSFTGCLGIYTAKDGKEGRARRIAGAVFYGFGLMFRWQAAFLALPYIALFVLANMADERFKKERIKAEILRILPWALVFTGLTVSRLVFYSFEPWKSDLAYDRARVTMADFPVLEWNELDELPEGVDRYAYYGATHWFFADTDVMSVENLQLMAEKGSIWAYQKSSAGIGNCLCEMGRKLLHDDRWLWIPVLLLVLLCVVQSLGKGFFRVLEIWLAFSGAFVILFYFSFRGRSPDRVWFSVLFAVFAAVICTKKSVKILNTDTTVWNNRSAFISAMLLFLGCFSGLQTEKTGVSVVLLAGQDADEESFSKVYDSGQLWVVSGWDKYGSNVELSDSVIHDCWYVLEEYFMRQGKLPTERFLRHFIPTSGFWYGQEYYVSLLKELGTENPVKALISQDRMRLWDRGSDSLFREFFYVYLYRIYGDMDVIRERTVDGYPVYRFEIKKGGKQ